MKTVSNDKVIVITGPTACGKTELVLQLARQFAIEVVSVDSAQVYRGMDIGTAKPDASILSEIPHHLIDIRDPKDPYSAADFRLNAIQIIKDIQARGNCALLSGGTMLYLKALKEGIAKLPPRNDEVRAGILEIATQRGWDFVHKRLQEVDPEAAARINPNDPQRIQRALEVYELTGKSMTSLHRLGETGCPFELVEIAIFPPDRKELHNRIAMRFDQMLDQGLLEEVRRLIERGDLHDGLPAIKSVGYRQVWAYLQGDLDYVTMREKAIAGTRQLAKRQYTWLRGWKNLNIIDTPDRFQVLKILERASIL
ncbi:MAG: tRNA (adenosine(37)-N6)-dimethylallyltransferase MiaA [Pseudomonadales bacterium]